MFHTLSDVGKELVGGWGKNTDLALTEHVKDVVVRTNNTDEGSFCVLCYISKLLEPISKVAEWQIEKINKEKSEKRREQLEKRKTIAKPWWEKLAKLRDKDNFEHKYYNKVLDGIRNCLWCYEYLDYGDFALKTAKRLLNKPVKKWQRKEILILKGVGKIITEGFTSYQETL